jgi:hypothetical protein
VYPRRPPPSRPPRSQPPAFQLDPGSRAGLFLLLLLLAAGTLALAALGSAHHLRIFAALGLLGIGCGVCIGQPRWSWPVRLGWVGAGVLGALAARWFVPTTNCVSLWQAGGLAAETEAIPVLDHRRFYLDARHRKAAMKEFPEFAAEIRAAERAWVRRAAAAAIEATESQLERDPLRAARELRELVWSLSHTDRDHWTEVREDLRPIRQKAVRACVQRLRKEGEVLIAHGEFTAVSQKSEQALAEWWDEVREVGLQEEVQQQLRQVRRKAVLAALDAARREVMPLLARDRHKAVADLGEQLARVLAAEARFVGAEADLEQFRRACEAFGDVARQDGEPDDR